MAPIPIYPVWLSARYDSVCPAGGDRGSRRSLERAKMPVENTDLERRVLAHEQILQALMAQLAEGEPHFLDRMQDRFASARRGAYEHDYVETADYAEAFIREVARLVRDKFGEPSQRRPAPASATHAPAPPAPIEPDDAVVMRCGQTGGVWHVTRNGEFFGDYLSEGPAREAIANAAREVERRGGRAELHFGPDR